MEPVYDGVAEVWFESRDGVCSFNGHTSAGRRCRLSAD